jgi:hypothetical protein
LTIVLIAKWILGGGDPQELSPEVPAAAGIAFETPPLRAVEPEREVEIPSGAVSAQLDSKEAPRVEVLSPLDEVGTIVWGHVLDAEKTPVQEGYVAFVDRLGERLLARTSTDGSYTVSGLAPGRWFVEAGAEGFLTSESWLPLESDTPRVRRDFQLERSTRLIVRVLTPEGRPFHEVDQERPGTRVFWITPIATKEPPTAGFKINNGDWLHRFGAGRHAFPYPTSPPGAIAVLELFEPMPLYVSLLLYQEVLATQLVDRDQGEVVFVLDVDDAAKQLAELEMTVLDAETRAPLADAVANFHMSAGLGQAKKADADGRIVLRGRAPGRYDFFIRSAGHASERMWIELPAGAKVHHTIALASGARIQGRVLDQEGQPFAAEIELGSAPVPGELPTTASEAFHVRRRTRGDGTFELEELPPGRWLLQFHDARDDKGLYSHMSANVVVDTSSGPVTDLVVRAIPTGRLVATWMGPDREGIELRFLDEAGLVRAQRSFWSGGPNLIALPQGPWRMLILDGNKAIVDEREISVSSEPLVLELGR